MSPLIAPPSRGYADMQRIANYDSPVLFSENFASHPGNAATPVLDVSRYAYIGGTDAVFTLDVQLSFSWWMDAAGTIAAGTRIFQMTPNIANPAQYRLPNLGPFVTITYTPLTAGTWQHTCELIGTNRQHPLEFIPTQWRILYSNAVSIPASGSETLYPTDFYAGPMAVFTNTTQVCAVSLQAENTSGTWERLEALTTVVSTNALTTWVAPPGAWRIQVVNTSGTTASTTTVTCTQSQSGAM